MFLVVKEYDVNGKITRCGKSDTENKADSALNKAKAKGCDNAFIYPAYDGTDSKYATVVDGIIIWDREAQQIGEAEANLKVVLDKRASEYPEISEYLDAKVKQASSDAGTIAEGEAQEQAYLEACLLVKENNPKPEA
jgi:hypothetical protein